MVLILLLLTSIILALLLVLLLLLVLPTTPPTPYSSYLFPFVICSSILLSILKSKRYLLFLLYYN